MGDSNKLLSPKTYCRQARFCKSDIMEVFHYHNISNQKIITRAQKIIFLCNKKNTTGTPILPIRLTQDPTWNTLSSFDPLHTAMQWSQQWDTEQEVGVAPEALQCTGPTHL